MIYAKTRIKRALKEACNSFAFRARMSALEWAESVRRMEGGRGFHFNYAPYQREMIETPYREDVQLTAYMMASRLGKTETVMNIIGHSIDEAPRRILVMYPTTSQAEKWSKETFEKELCEPTPALQWLVRGGRRSSDNTILHKLFPGGLMNIFGSNSPGEMRRAKGNLIFADEIDAMAEKEGDEGDQLEIFWMRGSEYSNTVKLAASYPSVHGHSRIASIMAGSDYRKYFTPCAKCDEPFVMLREHIRHPFGQPEKAEIECPHCSAMLTDDQRRAMVHVGSWQPTQEFNGIAGFWGNGMMSPHPVQKGFESHLHWVAQRQLDAETSANPERERRVLVNTFDALPFKAKLEEKPEANILMQRREPYQPHLSLPPGVLVVTWGADVQKDRIEIEFVGHGENDETWGLGYKIVQGSPLRSATWAAFDKVTLTDFDHPTLGPMKAACGCIDSKYRADKVRAWTRQRLGRRVFAVYGSSILGKPGITKPKKEGKPPVTLYEIGTNELKDTIYQRLDLEIGAGEVEVPQGYMHFPKTEEYCEAYFKGLVLEDSKLKKANDGKFYRAFECPKGGRNEPLDLRVYALAAVAILRPNFRLIAAKANPAPEEAEEVQKKAAKKRKTARRKNWMSGGGGRL